MKICLIIRLALLLASSSYTADRIRLTFDWRSALR